MSQGIFIQSTVIVQLFGATCKGVMFKFWIIQYTINVQVMELRVGLYSIHYTVYNKCSSFGVTCRNCYFTIIDQVLELRVGTICTVHCTVYCTINVQVLELRVGTIQYTIPRVGHPFFS